MSDHKISRVTTIFGWLFTIGLVLLGLEYWFNLGLLPLVIAVLGIGLLGVIVFGAWDLYW